MRLIDDDYLGDLAGAFEPVTELLHAAAIALRTQRAVQHIVNQRGFSRTAHTSNHWQSSQRNHQVNVPQIVQRRPEEPQKFAAWPVPEIGRASCRERV